MIFDKVTNIANKEEFLEKILIYIRLVEVIAEREGKFIPIIDKPTNAILSEMVDMGIINNEDEIKPLKKVVGQNYFKFINIKRFKYEIFLG